jgi:hypothetical protein
MTTNPNNRVSELNNRIIELQKEKDLLGQQCRNYSRVIEELTNSKGQMDENHRTDKKKYEIQILELQKRLDNKRDLDQSSHYQ